MKQRSDEGRIDSYIICISLVVILAFVARGVLLSDDIAVVTSFILFGDLEGLQTVAILAGAQFTLVMISMVYSLFRALRAEIKTVKTMDVEGSDVDRVRTRSQGTPSLSAGEREDFSRSNPVRRIEPANGSGGEYERERNPLDRVPSFCMRCSTE